MAQRPNQSGAGRAGDVAGAAAKQGASSSGPKFTLKPSKQSCIVLGALTALSLAASVGLYFWQTQELNDIQQQVDQTRGEVASGQKIASQLEDVKTDYQNTASKLNYLEKSVTENQYEPTLLHQIEDLATSTNLQVNSIRPVLVPAAKVAAKPAAGADAPPDTAPSAAPASPPPPTYDQLQLDMSVSGTYWDVATMLAKLPEFPKIIQVDSLQVSPTGQQTSASMSPALTVQLHLTGFIFPIDAVPPMDPLAGGTTGTPGSAPAAGAAPVGAPAGASSVPAAPQQRVMITAPSAHAFARLGEGA